MAETPARDQATLSPLAAGPALDAAGYLAQLSPPLGESRRLLLNMVSTVDGRATIGGRSGPIGGAADRALFHALRGRADAVLVGAGTARTERYGPMIGSAAVREQRLAAGLAAQPLACIVSSHLDLDPALPLLADAASRVVVITDSAGDLQPCAAQIEYLRVPGPQGVDLSRALDELERDHGVRLTVCEGGPHLGTDLLAAGLLDELWLTLGPLLAGDDPDGEARRILAGHEFAPPLALRLLDAACAGGELFLRYGVGSPRATSRATTD